MTLAINTGLEPSARDELAAGLSKLLADTYGAYLKTHGYHWNVRGPNFGALHALFMQQYTEVWAAIDTVAERIRALGGLAPQGYRAFANLSAIGDGDPEFDAEAMLRDLVKSHEALIATTRSLRPEAGAAGDEATVGLIDDRLAAHEKHVWMLRASLGLK
jgi:starvation-inducible DNA-binding protein